MRILKITDKNSLEIANSCAYPIITGRDEAIVRVKHICLCGSDYKLFNGDYSGPSKYPIVFGHEWSGEIMEINSDNSEFNVGDMVTGDCSKWGSGCIHSLNCSRDKNICSMIEKYGITIDGFAQEYVAVPLRHLYAAPSGISPDILALSELFSVALNGIKKSMDSFNSINRCLNNSSDDDHFLVIGAGSLGISIYILLKYMFKKDNVKILEISDERVRFINDVYPDFEFINIENKSGNNYADLLNRQAFNIIFEASGNTKALDTSLDLAQAGGTVVLLGMYPKGLIESNRIVLKALSLKGSIGGTGSFKEVITFLQNHQSLVSKMITKKVSVSDLKAESLFNKDTCSSIKTQIYFD